MFASAAQMLAHTGFGERPKLVVGIVVDQMRWDYLSRYYDQFQEDGFKRLITKGYS
ncbi:MAG: alkaline phosphatase family protein, partial [Paludibacteraceae bacterium]|nr:alkaline phosphatase family protein [Paludibacteraceae bacterium]